MIVGDILVQKTTPLTLFINPISVTFIGNNCFTVGHRNSTDPPPNGAAPLFLIFKVAPSTPKFLKNGNVTFLRMSTEISRESLVMPVRTALMASLEKTARGIIPWRIMMMMFS
jgi:hypothetical protein